MGYSDLYVGIGAWKCFDSLIFWTQHSHSFMVLSSLP